MTKAQIAKHLMQAQSALDTAKDIVNDMVETMQTYYDEKSEIWQDGEKGTSYMSAIEDIEELLENLEISFPDITDLGL